MGTFSPVDVALQRSDTVQAVRGLLAEMNADHVAMLTAKYLDGLTVPQMVEVMGGTNESLRSRLARARRDFRQRYECLEKQQDRGDTFAARNKSRLDGDRS